MIRILAGAAILVVVIAVYVAVSYMHDKKMGKGNSCDGNCAGCGMRTGNCTPSDESTK